MTRQRLSDRVRRFMDGSLRGAAPEPFESLALDIHAWQSAHDPVVRALTEAAPARWTDIPAVPVDLFKRLPVGTVKDEGHVVFRTSGTTQEARGAHRLRDTELYDHGALAWARRCVPDLPADVVGLLFDPAIAPDSSLSHMVALFPGTQGSATWHLSASGLDRQGLSARIAAATGPLFVATTGFSLADWLDGPVPVLPEGSLVMVTGGFKGRRTEVDADTLYAHALDRLRPRRVVTEYGMTELSSQLWGHPGQAFRPPPWLRAVAVDPVSAMTLGPGEPGQLRFYDLANLDSTLGVETLDRGAVLGDGAVVLHGRLDGAEVRGCSLTMEDLWDPS